MFETAEQRQLAYTLASESLVLLKNDDLLPLSSEIKSLAIIGPNADSWRNMIGDYAYPCHIETLKKICTTAKVLLARRFRTTLMISATP